MVPDQKSWRRSGADRGLYCGKRRSDRELRIPSDFSGTRKEVGASLGVMQSFYQGFFLAPTVVNSAVKGAVFAANIYERLGYGVIPNGTESRHDIIQAVELGSAEV